MTTPLPSRRRPGWPLMALVLAAVLGAVGSWAAARTQEPARRPTGRSALMRQKLDHAQRILGGLTTGEFAPVARSSRALRRISEEAAWYSLPTDDYRRFSDEFRRLTDALAAEAEDEDLDGATLAYVQLTVNCVECHTYVRIQMNPPGPPR